MSDLLANCFHTYNIDNFVHKGCVTSLAVSPVTGVVASASYDKIVKLFGSLFHRC